MDAPPTTMRAAFFEAARTMTVRRVPVPRHPAGEALLRVSYSGICGSDLSLWEGGALSGPEVVLGHEIAAVVLEDAGGNWTTGTRVAVFPPRGCGTCMWCRAGELRYCLDPVTGRFGGFAQYVAYPSTNLIPIPTQVDDRRAALADPLGVAMRAVAEAGPRTGDVVYVGGLGPIGLCTVSVLTAAGCVVIGGDPRLDRRRLGRRLGCVEVVDPTREDPEEATLSCDPRGARSAYECSGHPDGLQQIFDVCGHQGTVAILGIPKSPTLLLRMTVREQRAFSIAGPTRESMAAALRHAEAHPEIGDIITGVIGLDELGGCIEELTNGGGGTKVLVDPHR